MPSLHLNPAKDITDIDYFLEDSMPYTRFFLRNVGEFAVWGLGEHTAQNAALAILAALEFKKADSRAMQEAKTLDDICYSASHIQQVRENLKHFAGIKKRFDILCTSPLQSSMTTPTTPQKSKSLSKPCASMPSYEVLQALQQYGSRISIHGFLTT